MAGNNLTWEFKGDASQLNAEIKYTQRQIGELDRQLKAAFRKGDDAGARQLSNQIGKLQTNLSGLNATLAETGDIATATGRQVALSAHGFRSLEGAIAQLTRSFGGAKVAIVAFLAVRVAKEFADQFTKAVDSINELNKAASNLNMSPTTLKAFQDQLAKQGLTADQANAAIKKLSDSLFDAQLKAGTFNNVMTSGVNVMRGAESSINGISQGVVSMRGSLSDGADAAAKFVNVWRGGQPAQPVNDLTDAITRFLKINPAAFKPGDVEGYTKAVAVALQNTKNLNETLRSRIGQQIFGDDWQKVIKGITEGAKGDLDKLKKSAEQLITPEDQAKVDKYNESVGELTNQWNDMRIAAAEKALPAITSGLDTATQATNNLTAAMEAFKRAAGGGAFGDPSIPAMPLPGGDSGGGGGGGFSWPQILPPGMAEGGFVSGPGTGTSDSIVARLSDGEYVMRRAAVDHWGPRFMASLNALRSPLLGFASGGLVMPQRPVPHFAAGGMVTARTDDGTTVNLHFPGGSFALRADQEIVGGLTREARRAGMLSAGRMAAALN